MLVIVNEHWTIDKTVHKPLHTEAVFMENQKFYVSNGRACSF